MKTWLSLSLLMNILGILSIFFLVWWMGGISNLWARLANRGLTAEYDMLKEQYANLPMDTTEVLLLGNSLTNYGAWTEWLPTYSIVNRGIPGDGIEGLIDRLSDYKDTEPKVVLVMIGINDLAFHPKEWLIDRYPKLLDALEANYSEAKVVIQGILPINNDVSNTGLSNPEIDVVNMSLAELCTARSIEWLDLSTGFKNQAGQLKEDWTGDGLHLTGKAYEYWAGELKKILDSTLKVAVDEN